MHIKSRHVVLGLSSAMLLVSGVAYADIMMDRYFLTEENLVKATALLNAIEPANSAERKQRDKALKSLAAAHEAVNCAEARRIDPGAACP